MDSDEFDSDNNDFDDDLPTQVKVKPRFSAKGSLTVRIGTPPGDRDRSQGPRTTLPLPFSLNQGSPSSERSLKGQDSFVTDMAIPRCQEFTNISVSHHNYSPSPIASQRSHIYPSAHHSTISDSERALVERSSSHAGHLSSEDSLQLSIEREQEIFKSLSRLHNSNRSGEMYTSENNIPLSSMIKMEDGQPRMVVRTEGMYSLADSEGDYAHTHVQHTSGHSGFYMHEQSKSKHIYTPPVTNVPSPLSTPDNGLHPQISHPHTDSPTQHHALSQSSISDSPSHISHHYPKHSAVSRSDSQSIFNPAFSTSSSARQPSYSQNQF